MNIQTVNNYKQNVYFQAKGKKINVNQVPKNCKKKLNLARDFFSKPENIQRIIRHQEYNDRAKLTQRGRIFEQEPEQDITNIPFGPEGGSWPHERL